MLKMMSILSVNPLNARFNIFNDYALIEKYSKLIWTNFGFRLAGSLNERILRQLTNSGNPASISAVVEQDALMRSFDSRTLKSHLGKNKTDKVFDALSTILLETSNNAANSMQVSELELVEVVKLIVKEAQEKEQRKKNKVAWLCTTFTFLFLLFMILMMAFFVYRLHSITNILLANFEHNLTIRNVSMPRLR